MIFPRQVLVQMHAKEFCRLFCAIISYSWKRCIANMYRVMWDIMPIMFRTYDNIFSFVCIEWKSVSNLPSKEIIMTTLRAANENIKHRNVAFT